MANRNEVQPPVLGTLCLPLQAPYDPATVAQASNISLAVCGNKLRCITWASVQGADGINLLEVKAVDDLQPAALTSRKIYSSLLVGGAKEIIKACDYLRGIISSAQYHLAKANSPASCILQRVQFPIGEVSFPLQAPSPNQGASQASLLCDVSEKAFTSPYLVTDGAWSEASISAAQLQSFRVSGWQVIRRHTVSTPAGRTRRLVARTAEFSDLYQPNGTPNLKLTALLTAAVAWSATWKSHLPPVTAGQLIKRLQYQPSDLIDTAAECQQQQEGEQQQDLPPDFDIGREPQRPDKRARPWELEVDRMQGGKERRPEAAADAAGNEAKREKRDQDLGHCAATAAAAADDEGVDADKQKPKRTGAAVQVDPPAAAAQRAAAAAAQRRHQAAAAAAAEQKQGTGAAVKLNPAGAGDQRAAAGAAQQRQKVAVAAAKIDLDTVDLTTDDTVTDLAAAHARLGTIKSFMKDAVAHLEAHGVKFATHTDEAAVRPAAARQAAVKAPHMARPAQAAPARLLRAQAAPMKPAAAQAPVAQAAAVSPPQTAGPEETCPVCLEGLSGQTSLQLGCKHTIHADCLSHYLQTDESLHKDINQYVCPVCKAAAAAAAVAGRRRGGQQKEEQGWVITSSHIAQLTAMGALTAEQENSINRLQIRRALGAEYSCICCNMLLELIPGPPTVPEAYMVECGACCVAQCVACGIPWDEQHEGLTCAEMKARDSHVDPFTQRLLAKSVVCAGGCGHGITKRDSDRSCNVLKCQRCRVYTCFLCGEKLNSAKFDVNDSNHTEANAHYYKQGHPCYQAMWMTKDDWLRTRQPRNPAVAAAGRPAPQPAAARPAAAAQQRDRGAWRDPAAGPRAVQEVRMEVRDGRGRLLRPPLQDHGNIHDDDLDVYAQLQAETLRFYQEQKQRQG